MKGEKGFTLIEVVLVVLVGGIALIPLLSLFASTAMKSNEGELHSVASFLAKEKLDEIMGDRLAPGRGYSYIASGNYPAESPVSGFPDYVRTVTIGPDSTFDSVTFRTVKVTVARGTLSNITLTTWVVSY